MVRPAPVVVNTHDAKTRLSQFLEDVEQGADVVIARAGRPVARLVPITPPRPPRKPGALKGRIKDLVEFASAFGSAGVFVVACFGLFTPFGGPLSAWVCLCTGFVVWGTGAWLGWPAPYATALATSCLAYVVTAFVPRRGVSSRADPTT